jgi:uncharacterized membrane protein YgdD (TMEM256/DUF423 family)
MNRLARAALGIGAFFGGCSVICGAFGAHALRGHLDANQLQIWNTAAQYEMYHALALVLVSALAASVSAKSAAALKSSVVCFAAGTFIFSATLYVLALTGMKWLGAITPLGGLLLILGWISLLVHAASQKPADA